MLVSVAIGVALSYPTVFLSENPTAGFTSMPHQVWTTAKPMEGDDGLRADVEMRQVWVHGSYMQALNKDVLKSALNIQQTLVGGENLTSIFPSLGEKLKSSSLSWGYHSPLMYWNSSAELIDRDDDILRTVNDQAGAASSLNVVLRPASVFAGKTFQYRKLLAADALVLTLMNKVEDGVGSKWQDKMHTLEGRACENCTLFPPHGEISRNRVYEFSFTPLSARENIALSFAYGCMALYVALSLRRIKAFHSRFGLVVTAITQVTTSILASFTICGMLKINLATIPQNAYPFVVLVIGLENMFRLINAVLAYPPTMATELRIANALGDVGPLSVATAGQNLIILWLLSRVVSVGVAAFCAFAAIATLFDSFFLLTFFVAVLNVDVRRLELQDSLTRAHQTRNKRRHSPRKRTWIDALMSGRLPFSTRMAGSVVTTTFILSLNYHFFEHQEKALSLRHILGLVTTRQPSLGDSETFGAPPMNISLTPGEWMRMQDFDTAREVMRLVKPGAHKFIIRVFSPLIVVLSGADRTGVPKGLNAWTDAFRGFALHHFYPFAVVVVFVVTFVAVLMSFLLYNDSSEAFDTSDDSIDQAVTVRDVQLPHRLDIIRAAACEQGHLVTVSLDRSIALSLYERTQGAYNTTLLPSDLLAKLHWPIRQVAIDNSGDWIALQCADDRIMLYNRSTHSFEATPLLYPDDNPSIIFGFTQLPSPENPETLETSETHFIALTSGGRLVASCLSTGKETAAIISHVPLLGAAVVDTGGKDGRLMFVTDEATIICSVYDGSSWVETNSKRLAIAADSRRLTGAIKVQQFDALGKDLTVVGLDDAVLFINSQTLDTINTIDTRLGGATFSAMALGPQAQCPACGAVAVRSIGLVSDKCRTNTSIIKQLVANGKDDGVLCIRSNTAQCQSFANATVTQKSLAEAGTWLPTQSRSILGLRKKQTLKEVANGHASGGLARRRRHMHLDTQADESQEEWEAYMFCLESDLETIDVPSDTAGESASLYVTNPGPIVPLDSQSVAVAFGNSVKVIRTSRRSSISRHNDAPSLQRHSSMSRKRQPIRKVQ